MNAKRILCYGDSNTWGTIAEWQDTDSPSRRYPAPIRWPGVMAKALGEGYCVLEEGVEGRTTMYPTDEDPWTRGDTHLQACLIKHRPLDLAVLKLGVNDLKKVFNEQRVRLGDGMQRLIDIVRACPECGNPQILLVAEAPIRHPEGRQNFYEARDGENGCALSRQFAPVYRELAERNGCYFADAGLVGENDPADGLHLTAESHRRVGVYLADAVRAILEK